MSLFNIIPSLNREAVAPNPERPAGAGPALKPAYDVQKSADNYRLTVFLPGVAKENLELTAEDGEIRIVGRRSWTQPAGWTALHRETSEASYELVLTHDHVVDTDKIAAELRDGVLNVTLPKHEAVKPRKITVA